MLGELLKAIKLRWVAKSMVSDFPGGLSETQMIPGVGLPFVTVEVIGAGGSGRATSSTTNAIQQREIVTIDFTLHSRGGLSVLSGLAEKFKTAFNNMHAGLSSGVTLHSFFWMSDSIVDDPDHPNLKDWVISYQATLERSETVVNV